MGFNLESDIARFSYRTRLKGAVHRQSVKNCYHQHGPVFHIHGETVNILPIDDKVREEFINEMVKKYEQRSDGI